MSAIFKQLALFVAATLLVALMSGCQCSKKESSDASQEVLSAEQLDADPDFSDMTEDGETEDESGEFEGHEEVQ